MGIQVYQFRLLLLVLVLANLLTHIGGFKSRHFPSASLFSRSSFPAGFVFGMASSAYQYEGAAKEGGKGTSIWDTFTHNRPDKIKDHTTGDVAIDYYHRYKEDVSIMKDMGTDAHRFSISWSRLLPYGKLNGGVNMEGIRYYKNFINELLSNGIQPFATLFHNDLPQALEDKYGGFLSPYIVDDFKDYADLCFREFGDQVKNWITINEPWTFANGGFNLGVHAPGRCSQWVGNCSAGNSITEPYLVGHNSLLAHAAAVKVYREKYQASQKGKIGMALAAQWMEPISKNQSDVEATQRALAFMNGWFLSPLTYGYYPKIMQTTLKTRLPKFTKKQMKMVKGSSDFIGLNYYTSYFAANDDQCKDPNSTYSTDSCAKFLQERNGIPIGPSTASMWIRVYPPGIWYNLNYTRKEFNNPEIYITENGVSESNNSTLTLEEALADKSRIDYHSRHLRFVLKAIRKGVNVKGYFAWSLLDNFEWDSGFTIRFGFNYVDYKNGLKRYPKHSAIWFKKFLQRTP